MDDRQLNTADPPDLVPKRNRTYPVRGAIVAVGVIILIILALWLILSI